ncbi:type IV CRISPR-associated DEAD/DEAH-box helicase Csf4 [Paraburkholderia youngii]|uniref:type IV CRISPR-associated DEAD/DEAH-box helicase Csf4 n=1 Tax=Paraburkholderia youngii TaxID=2782701 RepID=UPI003D1F9A9C
MQLTFTVPEQWLIEAIPNYVAAKTEEQGLRHAVRDVIVRALKENTPIPDNMPDDIGKKVRLNLSLTQADSLVMSARMEETGLTPGPLAKRLVYAMRGQTAVPVLDPSDPMVQLIGQLMAVDPQVKHSSEQNRFASYLRDSLDRGQIGLVEAGTGVGKTRAMMANAIDRALKTNTRVVIAAPTIALLKQFAAEYAVQEQVRCVPPLRLIFGRREFVSEHDLRRVNDTRGDTEESRAIAAWINRHGLALESGEKHGVRTAWLAGTLEEIAPGFPVDEVRLVAGIPYLYDRGEQSYRAQFQSEDTATAEVVLCTHAMLAQDMRIRQWAARKNLDYRETDLEFFDLLKRLKATSDEDERARLQEQKSALADQRKAFFSEATEGNGLLPDFDTLLLDEAHGFEERCANALSSCLPLRTIVTHLRDFRDHGGRLTLDVINAVERSVAEVSHLGHKFSGDIVHLASDETEIRAARRHMSAIAEALEKIPDPRKIDGVPVERLRATARLLYARAILKSIGAKAQSIAYLRFSPIWAYPQLYLGHTSVEHMLNSMWNSLKAGAAVSATLYLKRVNGMSAAYQRILLGIPEERAAEYPPVIASWAIEPVKQLWTAGQIAKKLRPPTASDRLTSTAHEATEKGWLKELAPVIHRIHETAAGGVLVLMTSYSSIATLKKEILALDDGLEPMLVMAEEGLPVFRQAERFMRRRQTGAKPLWLAVGSAWTGIDVGGHDPWKRLFNEPIDAADDNVLTDLVIPRIPFGSNQSISHQWRIRMRPSMMWEILSTAFVFKQGLGRLIRRAGLQKNRRFFVLDGRLQDASNGSAYTMFEQLMAIYPAAELPADWSNALR